MKFEKLSMDKFADQIICGNAIKGGKNTVPSTPPGGATCDTGAGDGSFGHYHSDTQVYDHNGDWTETEYHMNH